MAKYIEIGLVILFTAFCWAMWFYLSWRTIKIIARMGTLGALLAGIPLIALSAFIASNNVILSKSVYKLSKLTYHK